MCRTKSRPPWKSISEMENMTSEEIWEFCDSKPGWAALTSIGQDGFPHTVAIGYFRLGETLYCGCRAGTLKCRNILANPKISLMLAVPSREEVRGVMFQGAGRVIEDPSELLNIKSQLADLRGEERPTSVAPGIAYVELKPERIRSWKR